MCAEIGSLGGAMGLASGVDWRQVIDKLLAIESKPVQTLRARENTINKQLGALRELNSLAASLKDKALKLSLRSNILAMSATTSGTAVRAAASPEALPGNHEVTVYRLATATRAVSTACVGQPVDLDVPLKDAGMAITPTLGFFTLDGTRITIDEGTSLDGIGNSVTSLINGAGMGITASIVEDKDGRMNLLKLYKPNGSIVLGSGSDTSNLLVATRLHGSDPHSTWTSAVLEGNVEGTMGASVSSDATITFSYAGKTYVTEGGLLGAEAGVTTLEEMSVALQGAINAKLQGLGSVKVSVLDSPGTGNGKLVITDDNSGGDLSILSLSGSDTTGIQGLLSAAGATKGETIISAGNMGAASLNSSLYTSRLTSTLKDSWLSGIVESETNKGTVGFSLSGNETVTIMYHGTSYETGALSVAVEGETSLENLAADLQNKINAALGGAGSVSVKVYDPEGTGNARLAITDQSPPGSDVISFSFTSVPEGIRLTAEQGAEAKGLMLVNGTAVTYDKYGDSLRSLLKRINSSMAGVKAFYDSVNDKVTLSADRTGASLISLEDVGGNIIEALNLDGMEAQVLGVNARYSVNTVNGGKELTSAANNITDAIPGVTLYLQQVSEKDDNGNYIPSRLAISQNTEKAVSVLREFVSSYNELLLKLSAYTSYDPKTGSAGLLNDTSQARIILQRLKSLIVSSADGLEGSIFTLRDIGIYAGGRTPSREEIVAGQLSMDESVLAAKLEENPERVYQLLAGYSGTVVLMQGGEGSIAAVSGRPSNQVGAGTYRIVSSSSGTLEAYFTPSGGTETFLGNGTITAGGSNSTLIPGVTIYAKAELKDGVDYLSKSANQTGVIKGLESYLSEITRSGGVLSAASERMQKQIKDIKAQAERLEKRLESYEARLVRQYSAMETILSSMQSQSQWLANQITVINRSWRSDR
jgi:flagellar hook-associated protein 2